MKIQTTNQAMNDASRQASGLAQAAQLHAGGTSIMSDTSAAASTLQQHQQRADRSSRSIQLKQQSDTMAGSIAATAMHATQLHMRPPVQQAVDDEHLQGIFNTAEEGGSRLIPYSHLPSCATRTSPPVQRATSVHYEKQDVKFKTPGTHGFKNAVVGKKMTATLDPASPIKGSTPSTGGDTHTLYANLNTAYADNYVRGHLLNDNFGGLGVVENLFPLSKAANHAHLEHAEIPVKSLLFNGRTVNYEVEAEQKSAGTDYLKNPASTLKFKVSVGANELINSSIPVDPVAGNWGLNKELENKGFGSQGAGIAPSRNHKTWINHGIKAGYYDKATNTLIGTSNQDTYY